MYAHVRLPFDSVPFERPLWNTLGILRLILVVTGLTALSTLAGPRKKAAEPPAKATPAAAPMPRPALVLPPGLSAEDAIAQLRTLYETNLEYEQAVAYADAVLKRDDLSIDQKLEAYRLQGFAKAVVEDPVDAERPFRLLLRARPDYDLPASTPPKILAVFRKVQSEERALASQLRQVERGRLIANLRVSPGPAEDATGGLPITFAYRVRDTAGVVESMRVLYRRAGQKQFSSLALERTAEGEWRGLIPGDVTADPNGFKLEYVTETADREGPLLTVGSEQQPRTIVIAPGQVPIKSFKPIPRGLFWTSLGMTAALGIATGVLGYLFNTQQSSFNAAVQRPGVEGADLVSQINRGGTYATATNVLLISTGVALAASLIFLPLTRFGED